ncbi:MAG: hypothetical protein IPJ86_09805 [Bacteroidetes bacterium]|nr:hypothetical protein [Bacteroidota bacterium]
MQHYSVLDFILLPIYLLVILMAANIYARKKKEENPIYNYFMLGLLAKIVGGLGLAFVYTIYYPGGDTTEYFRNVIAVQRLAIIDFDSFWHVMTEPPTNSHLYYFNNETGYAVYSRDPKAWAVVKLAFFIVAASLQSFLVTTVLCATISFAGIWRLFKVFATEFPDLKKGNGYFIFIHSFCFLLGIRITERYFYIKCVRFFLFKFIQYIGS